jgi:hypothetical protein
MVGLAAAMWVIVGTQGGDGHDSYVHRRFAPAEMSLTSQVTRTNARQRNVWLSADLAGADRRDGKATVENLGTLG